MQALLESIALAQPGTDACRLFHGRGGRHPGSEGWTLDWFAPVWVVTKFGETNEQETQALAQALNKRWETIGMGQPLNWVFQRRRPDGPASRAVTELMAGQVPETHVVTENGARYRVSVLGGQNRGLFLDMAEGRQWVRAHARHAQVLNLFAYTCAFSVAALQGDAAEVINLDMAASAIATGRENHRLNFAGTPQERRAKFLTHDLFHSWGKISRSGPYDLIIVDPPSFQKGSFIATKDYAKLMRRLPGMLHPDGRVMLCLNAPELGVGFLQSQMAEAAPDLVFEQRLNNPEAFADVDPDRALKVLIYRSSERER